MNLYFDLQLPYNAIFYEMHDEQLKKFRVGNFADLSLSETAVIN